MAEHFVAHLKIEKVERHTNQDRSSSSHGAKSDRVIDEVTQITIKASTLDALTAKLGQHINIIEEN